MSFKSTAVQLAAVATIGFASVSVHAADAVNLYSFRQPFLIKPMLDLFSEETGIKVNTVYASKGLLERLQNEGINSPADIVLTSDFGNLYKAVEAGITQAVESTVLEENIPAEYRDTDNHWFGLTSRARLIVSSKERVSSDAAPTSYADLAKPEYKGKLCTRSGKHNYMQALIASDIAHEGEEAARTWLTGMKENLARKPQGNDRAQVKAISEGECDIAIINSYYIGAMLADEEQAAWANAVNIHFPNQDSYGTHMNISGMALTQSAPNKENAIKLMEFLASDEAQKLYADINNEYPIKQDVAPSELVSAWGSFKADKLPLTDVVKNLTTASKMVDEIAYDN